MSHIDVLNRRLFLELATLSSAALMTASPLATGAPTKREKNGRASMSAFGKLHSMAPGAVAPEGWLQLYLQKQAQQLASHLPTISSPFTKPYWSGEEKTDENGWWGWEQKGYWVDGALRCALVLQDESLLRQALEPIDYTLNHVRTDGYLGPAYLGDPNNKRHAPGDARWPHNVFFRALAAHGEATGDPRVAAALRRHFLADRSRMEVYGGPQLGITNVEGMLWAYQRTGDRDLLDMAQRAWDDYLVSFAPGDRSSCDLHPTRVLAGGRIRAHGVSYAEKAKLPAILYLHTGNPEYLRYAIAAQERMFTHHMLIDGLPSSAEEFAGIDALSAHETCNIAAMTWGWKYLLMATGEGLWADRFERSIFNAGFGAIRKDWKGVQYFSCPNQVIATQDSSHVPYLYGGVSSGWMAYRPNPGRHVACCGGAVHRFLPNYAIHMWMADNEGGLAAVLYGPSIVRAEVGSKNEPIEIHQETFYPFSEEIQLTIQAKRSVSFPLSLRIPRWCDSPQLALNGSPIKLPKIDKGFICIERTFKPADRITLTLPMRTTVSFWPGTWAYTGLGLEHGPLVYALRVEENWSAVVTPKYSTPQFPEWEARPSSAWNYGIVGQDTQLPTQAKVERLPMTADPWVDPPVRLIMSMRKIPSWTLRDAPAPDHPNRQHTPALPESGRGAGEQVEQVALVPYGATQLRVSIFPQA